ncbi:rSAM/selenodomain-associated transferase 1 [Phycicoccus badiiscoriae]|uniref:RSAM/selenodomain-associated transferase 1 n=1 Tax=Pedococcus badiiscoriae TaxID=642776 RepID=A0A852WMA5_9MICO|nr:rSAM/selenodomain-associated transferase 1 [Pedococcus badiiscoriae]
MTILTPARDARMLRPERQLHTVIILAKSPQPGRVKTRLTPTFSPREAAALAGAAIRDTLDAARSTGARTLLCWEGAPAPWLPAEVPVQRQSGGGLADRLDRAFRDCLPTTGDRPTLLVGMDTPQVGATDLSADWGGADAVLGLSDDGGYWAIGLRRYQPGLFAGVPMSTHHTGSEQLDRLVSQGLSVHLLPTHRDVDEAADAIAAARTAPHTRFARTLHRIVATPCDPSQLFDTALVGGEVHVEDEQGGRGTPLAVASWRRLSAVDEIIVSRCSGPVLDIGCGPGRFVEALAQRGLPALGIDVSGGSVVHTRARGASALRRNVFEPVPGEGRWRTLLLADGNVGIGGDPRALLSRCRELLSPEGWALVEVDPDESVDLRTRVTLTGPLGRRSTPFPWAVVGATALVRYAAEAGLLAVEEWRLEERAFVTLRQAA